MLYSCQVKFEQIEPLVFSHKDHKKHFKKAVFQECFLHPDQNRLVFLNESNNPIAKLYLSPYFIHTLDEKSFQICHLENPKDMESKTVIA